MTFKSGDIITTNRYPMTYYLVLGIENEYIILKGIDGTSEGYYSLPQVYAVLITSIFRGINEL